MRPRLALVCVLAAGLLAVVAPAAASAKPSQTTLNACVHEAKHALKGTGVIVDPSAMNVILGTDEFDELGSRMTSGRDLVCGFGEADDIYTYVSAGDIVVGGAGSDAVMTLAAGGYFVGGSGGDIVWFMYGGRFFGGSGSDTVGRDYCGGTLIDVEYHAICHT